MKWEINLTNKWAVSDTGLIYSFRKNETGEWSGECINPEKIPPDDRSLAQTLAAEAQDAFKRQMDKIIGDRLFLGQIHIDTGRLLIIDPRNLKDWVNDLSENGAPSNGVSEAKAPEPEDKLSYSRTVFLADRKGEFGGEVGGGIAVTAFGNKLCPTYLEFRDDGTRRIVIEFDVDRDDD